MRSGSLKKSGGQCVALIVARGGSKGLPRKNVLDLGGKPLIAWTIEAAKAAKTVDRVILSSEDDEIIEIARQWGCEAPFKRPAALSADDTPSMHVVMHALSSLPQCELLVLLQPTSPMRTARDIDEAVLHMRDCGAPACVSVVEAQESPYWMYCLDSQTRMKALMDKSAVQRRQDLPKIYSLNGAVYAAQVDWLQSQGSFVGTETVAYVMPRARSHDIDTAQDLEYVRWTLQRNSSSNEKP